MPSFKRTDRINEQLREEISLLVRDGVRDPRVSLATITAVMTSPELDHAKVYFTALGTDEERKALLAGLRSAAPFIRRGLAQRLHMRRIPELHFEQDRVLEEAQRIEMLLREALPHDRLYETPPDRTLVAAEDASSDDTSTADAASNGVPVTDDEDRAKE
ncbi:MAG TPA: 30S ribosome-binding factor RbfA [Longimicrobium sp.]|nr:30S ribosome-binding factor RbfA [Longimicrobium sp.]